MVITVDVPDIARAEQHRSELRRIAACANRGREAAPAAAYEAVRWSSPVEQRRLRVSLREAWASMPARAVESADPLGVWWWGDASRRSFAWPDRRMMIDWGVWLVLLGLAGYLAAAC